jgi:transcriptional regulator with XRE-family HTH domain
MRVREAADVRRAPARPRLLESPLAALRRRHRLSRAQAAALLGVPVLRIARLEAATRRLPAGVLATITERLTPPERFRQLTIMDHVRAIVEAGEHAPTVGEGRCDA